MLSSVRERGGASRLRLTILNAFLRLFQVVGDPRRTQWGGRRWLSVFGVRCTLYKSTRKTFRAGR